MRNEYARFFVTKWYTRMIGAPYYAKTEWAFLFRKGYILENSLTINLVLVYHYTALTRLELTYDFSRSESD